jgi:hypothetical protein
LLDGDVAVSFHDNLASHFRAAVHGGGWHRVWPADKYTRSEGLSAAFAKAQFPNGIVSSVSLASTTN